jgi:hypothetical protein
MVALCFVGVEFEFRVRRNKLKVVDTPCAKF